MAVGKKDKTVVWKRKELLQQLGDQLITKKEFDKKWKSFLDTKESFEAPAEYSQRVGIKDDFKRPEVTWATPPAEVKKPATKPIPKKPRTKRPSLDEQIKERKKAEEL